MNTSNLIAILEKAGIVVAGALAGWLATNADSIVPIQYAPAIAALATLLANYISTHFGVKAKIRAMGGKVKAMCYKVNR